MQSSVYEKSTKVSLTKQEYRVQLSLTHKVYTVQLSEQSLHSAAVNKKESAAV